MARLILLIAICVFGAGCFVLDELDSGKAQMEKNSPKKPGATAKAKQSGSATPTGEAWWSTARSLDAVPADADEDDPNAPVACRIAGGTRFMRRSDCLSQGGRPGS